MGVLKVSEPDLRGNEKKYLCQAIDEGQVGQGRFVELFEAAFARWSGNRFAVAVASGTAALETAVWSMKMDEIDMPTGTIISCYIAAIRAGAKVNLHDNVKTVGQNLMRVHLFGEFNDSTGIHVVDDCSQYWQPMTVQDVGCYSLYGNKLITSGEGGVLVTNRRDIYERAIYYRNLCFGEERFVHHHLGYNFRMSNLQAAVALAQLERIDEFVAAKRLIATYYWRHLPQEVKGLFDVPVPWMFLVETSEDAGKIVKEMSEMGVECRRFFYPIHKQPCLPKSLYKFPVAEDLWEYAFYLPSGVNLTESEVAHVCNSLRSTLRSL